MLIIGFLYALFPFFTKKTDDPLPFSYTNVKNLSHFTSICYLCIQAFKCKFIL